MKFKLDENLGPSIAAVLAHAGHDVETVRGEGMGGCPDVDIFAAACREKRCLVTLDLDFSDVTRFPPATGAGVAVLRTPARITPDILLALTRTLVAACQRMDVRGQLWIVETGRIRVHQSPD